VSKCVEHPPLNGFFTYHSASAILVKELRVLCEDFLTTLTKIAGFV